MERRILDITMHTHGVQKLVYEIGDEHHTYGFVYRTITAKLSELDANVHIKMDFTMEQNTLFTPTEQEWQECKWLFQNLVKVIGYDLSSLVDENVCDRINSALPTHMKIYKKGE